MLFFYNEKYDSMQQPLALPQAISYNQHKACMPAITLI
ncbi:hypothetical protein FHS03_000347 [Massilia violacea]|uniref:Uncharacterized protein n=1 Tax=Pseudoduganella violacea TaxID=1715466 RepID=A0A7W5B691_9BURK|nr:hypothetical protein [Pseudoduganella violacea]